jgi:hypothetical protein
MREGIKPIEDTDVSGRTQWLPTPEFIIFGGESTKELRTK